MAKRGKKTKRRSDILIDLSGKKGNLAAILSGIDKMISSIAGQQGKRRSDITRVGEIKGPDSQRSRLIYGFSMKLEEPEAEPRVDVFPKSGKIRIIAEIPGVKEDKIRIKIKNDILELKAEDSGRKYYKKISLPFPVKKRPGRKSYRSGILRITLEKRNR